MEEQKSAIVTFYSFKGGVGRSMALANVAWLLAGRFKKNVLIIDWDLEAPGLHRFFDLEEGDIRSGLIDLLYDYKDLLRSEDNPLPDDLIDIDRYITPVNNTKLIGSISILAAGKFDNEYASRVNEFKWDEFYAKWHGFGFIEYLKKKFRDKADIVLIDSRTGITDIGGICTLQIPDVVVLLFALNEQNIAGIENIIQSIRKNSIQMADRKSPPRLLLRPARVERYLEQKVKDIWEKRAAKRLGIYLSDEDDPVRFMKRRSIPYIGAYSFGETPLAVKEDANSDLGEAFVDLTMSVLSASGISSDKEISYLLEEYEIRKKKIEQQQRLKKKLVQTVSLQIVIILIAAGGYFWIKSENIGISSSTLVLVLITIVANLASSVFATPVSSFIEKITSRYVKSDRYKE